MQPAAGSEPGEPPAALVDPSSTLAAAGAVGDDPVLHEGFPTPPRVGFARAAGRGGMRAVGLATSPFRRPPEIVVAGAKRAGTTTVARLLEHHPQVVPLFPSTRTMPLMRANKKSPKYFDRHHGRGPRWYRSHFATVFTRRIRTARTGGVAAFDAGSGYFHHPDAPSRIARELPAARVVVSLRDPVVRAYSHWKLNRIDGVEPLDFAAALAAEPARAARAQRLRATDPWRHAVLIDRYAYVAHSRYVEDAGRYLAALSPDRVHFLCAEEMFADPVPTFSAMCSFLGLGPFAPPALPAQNASSDDVPPPEAVARLVAELRAPTAELSELLGRSFPWSWT